MAFASPDTQRLRSGSFIVDRWVRYGHRCRRSWCRFRIGSNDYRHSANDDDIVGWDLEDMAEAYGVDRNVDWHGGSRRADVRQRTVWDMEWNTLSVWGLLFMEFRFSDQ